MGDSVLCLGSCFADEMAQRMVGGGLRVEQNPFGTLYNPASIAQAIEWLIGDELVGIDSLVQHGGLWHSWLHHGSFSHSTAAETLSHCNDRLAAARRFLPAAKLLIITFGTAYVYTLHDSGKVVANCHKLPADCFKRSRLQVEEIVSAWQPLLARLRESCPQLRLLFTVSPIRHLSDGLHENQLSKSTLLLSVDRLLSLPDALAFPAYYFPAYEIVLDELRDYRFYAPDLTHPSSIAADIVWHRLQEATMTPATMQMVHNNHRASLKQKHIPLHP